MERNWLKYVGVILEGVGGFVIGFGYGSYFTFSAIMGKISDIGGQLVGWIPLIGSTLAKTVERELYKYLMRYAPDVIPLYIIGFLLLASGVGCIHYSMAPQHKAQVKVITPQPVEPEETRYCRFCGAQITTNMRFCPKCGESQGT